MFVIIKTLKFLLSYLLIKLLILNIIFSNSLVTIGEDEVKYKTTNNKTYFDYENDAIL